MISVITKRCSKCALEKDISFFGKRSDRPDGLQYFCKQCARLAVAQIRLQNPERAKMLDAKYRTKDKQAFNDRQRKYREMHREQHRERVARWKRNNPQLVKEQDYKRRALKNSDKKQVTAKELKMLLQKDCFYCGSASEQIDHVVPLARGGRHSIGNLVQSCAKCNRSKGSSFVVEWKRRLSR